MGSDEHRPEQSPPQQPKQSAEEERRELMTWHKLTGVGVEFIVAVLMFGGIGWWIDSKAGTTPWLMLVGFALGFATGLYLMVRAANRLFRD